MALRILIIGGGFGGLAAANELRANLPSDVKITIIDRKDYFMMDLVKLWIIKGTRKFETSKRPLNTIVKKGIDFVNEQVTLIDTGQKKVKTATKELSYDYLIVAAGVELAPEKITGLSANGMILYDLEHVSKIRQKILDMKSGKIVFAITGMPYKCPPAPFEAALIISSMLQEIGTRKNISIDFYSLGPITLPAAGPEVSKQLLDILESENIKFHGSHKIMSVEQNTLKFEDQSTANFDLLIAVPPHKAPQIIYDAGLAQEGTFIPVKRDCKTQFDKVYAIGDVTNMMATEKIAVPKAGIFAEGQGIAVAQDIISQIRKEKANSIFEGKGGCFVEMGTTAGYIYVDMFAEPNPITRLDKPATEHMVEKEQFEKERLEKWL
ncbi:NAD(P)/FAD-dependent oxidoreductase [Candidatus Nitrosotenuis sp. DW1]|uniref:NAD(P)/FAD-dependent oxidoreductase n=1 Tax=Candidatus Nitrosotenuis sp. DW1 TaxID=2259672 RepID=UPI0015CB626C|nr:FAD/NAD(P)-binding oxidoreductase [Candidatus Nitrosotenuis sp. DW1]QLH09824.1 NAD(P)/FAD-dependent oxidoreductase [Candidatus Nitrosotenuis sp. DW1]